VKISKPNYPVVPIPMTLNFNINNDNKMMTLAAALYTDLIEYPNYRIRTYECLLPRESYTIPADTEQIKVFLNTNMEFAITDIEAISNGGKPKVKSSPNAWKLTAKTNKCKDGVVRRVYIDGKGMRAVRCKVGDHFMYKTI